MRYFLRRTFDLSVRAHTPPEVYAERKRHRREFLKWAGILAAAPFCFQLAGCGKPSDEEIFAAGKVLPEGESEKRIYPAPRNPRFEYGRAETPRRAAAEYANFYEFTSDKDVWRSMPNFDPEADWKVRVEGDCNKPKTFDMDDIFKTFKRQFEERAYRHRCVETWAMCVPWTGFPLAELLKRVEPKSSAKYVAFETFGPRDDAPNMSDSSFPWAYHESLTLAEAMNELTFLATGIYGEPLPKQHGTPIRLVVPWKYGFKSIKSLVRITLTDKQPGSFWNSLWPQAYDLTANVDPAIRHPSWSQKVEWMLGTRDRHPTVRYNCYGDYVGWLYPS
jgi:methionine sulfoxide reductase catalytic subunit